MRARIQENADDLIPKIIEIISNVLDENVDIEDSEKIASLQLELTKKYSDRLRHMDEEINSRIEEYIRLYEEAIKRIVESETENKIEDKKN